MQHLAFASQNLLGVRFYKVKDTKTWHPDAQMFAVWAADAKDELDFVGYCYLDLPVPCVALYLSFLSSYITHFTKSLESKYSHMAVWGLLPGYICPQRIAALSVGCGILAVGLTTR